MNDETNVSWLIAPCDLRRGALRATIAAGVVLRIGLELNPPGALLAAAGVGGAVLVPGALESRLSRQPVGYRPALVVGALTWVAWSLATVLAARSLDPSATNWFDPAQVPWRWLPVGMALGLPVACTTVRRVAGRLPRLTTRRVLASLGLSGVLGAGLGVLLGEGETRWILGSIAGACGLWLLLALGVALGVAFFIGLLALDVVDEVVFPAAEDDDE